jgi:hypothetical protein
VLISNCNFEGLAPIVLKKAASKNNHINFRMGIRVNFILMAELIAHLPGNLNCTANENWAAQQMKILLNF